MAVELALYDYNQVMQNNMIAVQMQMSKSMVIEAILKDHPKAIAYLKQQNLLK